jgi:YidC/Oxa1 family membrane protein insertase
MMDLFNEVLYRPLYNFLIFLYNFIPGNDFGVAIIALTIIIRLIFAPLSIRTQRAQRALSALNPKLQEIKEKYKNDQAAQSTAMLQLYKEHNVNPLAGCLPILIQLPILIALYRAFLAGFKPESLDMLYGFIQNPGVLNEVSFGFLNITIRNSFLAITAGVAQFVQARLATASQSPTDNPTAAALSKQMLYFFPIMIIFITWKLPAGLALYWITSTLFSIGEQLVIKYRYTA